MDVNELLVRTMNASKEAQDRGFYETADAFDEIVESLLDMLNLRAQLQREAPSVTHHVH